MFGLTRRNRLSGRWLLICLLVASCLGCAGLDPEQRREQFFSMRLPKAGGETVNLSEFRGQVLLVDIFNTWSQSSMLAITGYAGLYRRYHQQGLSCLGIALDKLGSRVVRPYVEGMDIPYPVALADEAIRQGRSPLGDVSITPMLLIFDRSGILKKIFLGFVPIEQVERIIEKLL
ncbi:MAG: TlpA family protein disulfide reductase [Deltaproteobacteria bacterium]|nr:TlpA family protein disulfide reductase [Deltaproteobacteria bacterium]MBW1870909.1 TlpA family protein disulfide reductase [Deltaproteobacteria bacterium]